MGLLILGKSVDDILEVAVLGTKNILQTLMIMPQIKKNNRPSLLDAPKFQLYLSVHTKVKAVFAVGC